MVDAGHHSRRLFRLTGLDVQDNQARRLLNDLDSYVAATDRQEDDPQLVAHDWSQNVFQPTIRAVPRELRRKLEPAQLFHEILDHRWFISEQAGGRDIPMPEATASYVENVLRHRRDEKAILGLPPGEPDREGDVDIVDMDAGPPDAPPRGRPLPPLDLTRTLGRGWLPRHRWRRDGPGPPRRA